MPLDLLQFVDHNPEGPVLSPDRKWIAYFRGEQGRRLHGLGDDVGRRELWVRRSDGSADRRLAMGVGFWHVWLNPLWLYFDRCSGQGDETRQLGIADARTGASQMLTAGRFYHWLTDFRAGHFLVEEHPPGLEETDYQADLYVIEPLRVAM